MPHVPILVPVFDEIETRARRNQQRYAREDGTIDEDEPRIGAEYKWVYRPEMQFSVLDLEINAINRTSPDDTVLDIHSEGTPIIPSTDKYVDILYELLMSPHAPLDRLGYTDSGLSQTDPENVTGKPFIFVLGEDEVTATFGPDQTVRFTNLDHLARLQPEDFLSIRLYSNDDAENVLWEFAFATIGLITDLNRDGHILRKATNDVRVVDIKNSKEHPFYFWINDDDDEGDINEGKGAGGDIPGDNNPDHDDDAVDGIRDLVDFFPVYVDVKAALNSYPPESYTYRLKHSANGALKFFETDLLPDSTDKQKRPNAPLRDTSIAMSMASHTVTALDANGSNLSIGFLRKIQADRGGVILVEAAAETVAPLVLEVVDGGTQRVVATAELHLGIKGVESMYRHINLQSAAAQRGAAPQAGLPENLGEPSNYKDADNEAEYLVFVHGYNVPGQAARGWNAEFFKRFYRLGFAGRFIGVTWHGDTGADYHHAVYNAFQTSMVLQARVSQAISGKPGPVAIIGHSLGNVVASNAIAHGNFRPQYYFMLNATTPIESFDVSQTVGADGVTVMSDNMTEAEWADYPPELYTANWHQLFPNDDRGRLTWKGRFSGAAAVAYNFYSPGEEVVENATAGETVTGNLIDRLGDFMNGQGLGRHAWVSQEIAKGCKNFIAGWFVFDNCSAGWSFNNDEDDAEYVGEPNPFYNPDMPDSAEFQRYQTGPAAAGARSSGALTDEELAQFGFFRHFTHYSGGESYYEELYAPINQGGQNIGHNAGNAVTASQRASANETLWDQLASGIPTLSFAAAANPMSILDLSSLGGENRNFSMEAMRDATNGWPASRLSSSWSGRWLHSDVRNMATPYVYETYEKMLELGGFSE